jgi:hypothetical protein
MIIHAGDELGTAIEEARALYHKLGVCLTEPLGTEPKRAPVTVCIMVPASPAVGGSHRPQVERSYSRDYPGLSAHNRFRLYAVQTSVHSVLTFSIPRSMNWPNPMGALMIPNVGSTVLLRFA